MPRFSADLDQRGDSPASLIARATNDPHPAGRHLRSAAELLQRATRLAQGSPAFELRPSAGGRRRSDHGPPESRRLVTICDTWLGMALFRKRLTNLVAAVSAYVLVGSDRTLIVWSIKLILAPLGSVRAQEAALRLSRPPFTCRFSALADKPECQAWMLGQIPEREHGRRPWHCCWDRGGVDGDPVAHPARGAAGGGAPRARARCANIVIAPELHRRPEPESLKRKIGGCCGSVCRRGAQRRQGINVRAISAVVNPRRNL